MFSPHLVAATLRAHMAALLRADARVERLHVFPVGLVLLDQLDVLGSGHVGVQRRTVLKDHVQRHVVAAVAR